MTTTPLHSASLVHVTHDAEQLISKLARVSNPTNEDNHKTAPRLIRYLIDHQHWSPFEMASMCVEIHTTRDISAQILRHRSFSFQEFSTRYAEVADAEIPDLRGQDLKNRQNSIEGIFVPEWLKAEVESHINSGFALYHNLLDHGVAKECARRILPLSTRTRLYMHGTIRSWIHYLQVRTNVDTQLEHRRVACSCMTVFQENFPNIFNAAFLENDPTH